MSPAPGGRGDGRRRRARPDGRDGARRPAPVRPTAGAHPVDRSRSAAYDVIRQVWRDDAYANLALPRLLADRAVTGRDAALATELCYGTLRATGTLDAVLAACSDRPARRIDAAVRDALRLGAYQLLYTRIPPHAAVSTTVALTRSAAGAGAAKFVNAVLRRVAGRDVAGWLELVAPAATTETVARLAVREAHPEWIVRALADALGDEAELAAALAADNQRPVVHLVARPGRITTAELAEQSGGRPGRWSPWAVYLPAGDPAAVAAVRDGRAGVQDEGSQLVADALVVAPLAGRDERWLDLCAGPGGKAALLGALARRRGARLTAVEVAEHRAGLVRQATAGLPVRVHVADGRRVGEHPDLPAGGFDRVLVDAPCTGLGALRRRPEARWRRTESDLADLTALQRELLTAACRAVRPGGLVGYVTCSPHPAETDRQVSALLADPPVPLAAVPAAELLPPNMPGVGGRSTVQLWPHRHGTDAMFVSLLRRTD